MQISHLLGHSWFLLLSCTGRSVRESAAYMKGEISSSFKGTGYASSFLYDVFQEYTQGIAH